MSLVTFSYFLCHLLTIPPAILLITYYNYIAVAYIASKNKILCFFFFWCSVPHKAKMLGSASANVSLRTIGVPTERNVGNLICLFEDTRCWWKVKDCTLLRKKSKLEIIVIKILIITKYNSDYHWKILSLLTITVSAF